MHSRLAIVFPLLLLAADAQAQSTTIGDVGQWCRGYPGGGYDRLCEGYLGEALKLLADRNPDMNGGHRACVPGGTPLRAVVDHVQTWLAVSPARGDMGVVPGAGLALQPHYPCRDSGDMHDARRPSARG